jgi:hypothetical protein
MTTSQITSAAHVRDVAAVLPAQRTFEGEGFLVWRGFPSASVDLIDPFLLLDEMGPTDYAPGEAKGAPDHPHRGFETVTYVLEGAMEHKDSAGHHGFIGPGDVQWMTAGAGVVHSEMPAEAIQQAGGRVHGVQLWVNLPRADKMTAPRYQGVTADEIPEVAAGGATVRVIAGAFDGHAGAVETNSPVTYFHVTVPSGSSVRLPVPEGHNGFAYLLAGEARFGSDQRVAHEHELVRFDRTGDTIDVTGPAEGEPGEVLVLAGKPLNEPIARYGPFVMNTREEIIEAVEDFQAGRMGQISH